MVSYRSELARLKASSDLPPVYLQHKIVLDHPTEDVVPVALFIDAVPYSQSDSVLGAWGVALLTGHRFLFAALRKRNTCRCGCRGWCSFYTLFEIATWSLESLAAAKWPATRHDGSQFRIAGRARAARAGYLCLDVHVFT